MNYLNKALDLFNTAVVRTHGGRFGEVAGGAWVGQGGQVSGAAGGVLASGRHAPEHAPCTWSAHCRHLTSATPPRSPRAQVTPIYYVMFTTATCAASMVMMREQQTAAQASSWGGDGRRGGLLGGGQPGGGAAAHASEHPASCWLRA